MAKRLKEQEDELDFLNSIENKNKTRAKKTSPSKPKNKKKNKKNEDNGKFNFDNEIVIGINVIPNEKNEESKKKSKKVKTAKDNNKDNNNSKKNTKETKKKKERRKIIDEDKYRRAKKMLICIVTFIISAAILTGVGIFLVTTPLFNITQINVKGNSKISTDTIISLSKIELNTNTYKILKSKVEENIKENAYIEKVVITRKLPNELNIEVSERKPQYMLKFGNAYVYINTQGYMLEVSEEKLEVPIITGYITKEEELVPGNRLCDEDLKRLEVVLKIMDNATINEIDTAISEINVEKTNNYILELEDEKKTAYLGDASNISDKMAVLKQILIKEKKQEGEAFLKDKDKMYFKEK